MTSMIASCGSIVAERRHGRRCTSLISKPEISPGCLRIFGFSSAATSRYRSRYSTLRYGGVAGCATELPTSARHRCAAAGFVYAADLGKRCTNQ